MSAKFLLVIFYLLSTVISYSTEQPNFKNLNELQKLKSKGHQFDLQKSKFIGRVDAIMVDKNGNITVGADKRGDDFAQTY